MTKFTNKILFVGYGDNRTLTETNTFERQDRQFFLKVSYAFQMAILEIDLPEAPASRA